MTTDEINQRALSTLAPRSFTAERSTDTDASRDEIAPTAALIIPAHNEEANIASLLECISSSPDFGSWRVIVVVNGSTDATFSIARRYDGVIAVEIDEASKIAALNVGDRLAGEVFPRLYVDADVTFTAGTIEGLIAALRTDDAAVASPPSTVDTSASTWMVRAFYRALSLHPVVGAWRRESMGWRRIYGANAAARSRFAHWPALWNDDGFFESIFAPHEKNITEAGMVSSGAPRTLRGEIRRQLRIHRGNQQLDAFFEDSQMTRHRWRAEHHPLPLVTRLTKRAMTWTRLPLSSDFWRGGALGMIVRALVMRIVRLRLRLLSTSEIAWG